MTWLPLVERELRLRARSAATYWTRFAVGFAGVVVCVQSMGSTPLGLQSGVGTLVFNGIVGAAFLLSCGACLLTADAISVERREGTLGLLFLTRVRALDVLVGKLGSVGLVSLCALGAFLPVLMVPVLAGGVTGGDAFRKGLGLCDALFFALAAGLYASATQQQRFKASRSALLLVGMVSVLPLLPFAVARGWVHRSPGLLSPVALLLCAGDRAYALNRWPFWASFAAVQSLAWVLLAGAALRLRRIVGEQGGALHEAPVRPVQESDPLAGLGRWQPDKEDASPIEWLVYRQQGVKAGLWGLAVLALGFSGWMSFGFSHAGGTGPGLWLLAWPLETAAAAFGGAVVAWVASRFFLSVRRTGELEVLLTTPVGAEAIASDQWRVLKRFFGWPVVGVQAAFLLPLFASAGRLSSNSWAPVVLVLALSFANTWFGVQALCWVGMWFGLRGRSQAGGILWTVVLAKGTPCLLVLLGSIVGVVLLNWNGHLTAAALSWMTWVPQTLILGFYLALGQVARQTMPEALQGGDNGTENWAAIFRAGLRDLSGRAWVTAKGS